MKEKKYKAEIMVTHVEIVWAENEEEAKEKAQSKVFEKKGELQGWDLITGYRITKIKK